MNDSNKNTLHAAMLGWWAAHIHAESGVARKTRAQLRRASRPSEILVIEATHSLHARIRQVEGTSGIASEGYSIRLALIASTLAGVDNHVTTKLASRCGQLNGDMPVVSQLRFQRILSASDDWVLATRLRRALPQVKRSADVASLGTDLFYWGETVRNRWCFQYFGSTVPDTLSTEQTTANTEVA